MATDETDPRFKLNARDSEAYKSRLRVIRNLAKDFLDLEGELPSLIGLLESRDPVDKESTERIIRLWARLLSLKSVEETFSITPPMGDESHWLRMGDLDALGYALGRIRETFRSLSDLHMVDHYIQLLTKQLRAALRRSKAFNILGRYGIDEAMEALAPIEEDLLAYDVEVEERQRRRQSQAAAETEEVLSAAKAAAGSTGQTVMSTFYSKLGSDEAASADRFRKLTVQFAISGGLAALIFLLLPLDFFGPTGGADVWVRLAQKAIFLGGVFALAGYFAKQSHQHRSLANWAQSLAVQLQTFEAYLAAVEDPRVRDELIKNFAGRAFGEHPTMKGEQAVTSASALVDTATNIAAKFTAAAK